MSAKIVVLDGYCLNPGDLSWEGLEKLGDVTVYDKTENTDILSHSEGAEIIYTNKTPLTKETIDQLGPLKFIGVLATGYNVVDVDAAAARGISVTNVPTYGTDSVAQHAIALLLELCHHIGQHDALVRDGEWQRDGNFCFWKTPLIELAGMTMGVIGLGRIGRRTAEIALALGMKVNACDEYQGNPIDNPNFSYASLEKTLASSDVISLHCPQTPKTTGIISKDNIAKMKSSVMIINASRGGLVVEQDLADALNEGRVAGAGLDVMSSEPPAVDNPLLSSKNTVISPHIAWAQRAARKRLLDVAVDNAAKFLDGVSQNSVNGV
jgi:glycerate dehydrogenase